MADKKTRIAIIYDFDKTLSVSEMQDAFIQSIGMNPNDFWKEASDFAKKEGMDKIHAYLYEMIRERKVHQMPLNRRILNEFGSSIEFHPGVLEWFDAIDELAKIHDVIIEHYIISSGLKEIIEGTPIYNRFKNVYACEYYYDENGVPVWTKNVVNFTSKTQFLFRINKGELDIWDDCGVNEFVYHDDRPIPFENMIYIGDGMTDIPCMKLVKQYGGNSIGVYNNDMSVVRQLRYDDRINYYCKADYSKDKDLYNLVSRIISKISVDHPLRMESSKMFKDSEKALNLDVNP